jgi:hypothetical protein
MPSEIFKILQPVKMKSNGRVIGYFYRMRDDGTLQYVSFDSTVDSIEAEKVEPATPAELEATKQRQRESGARGWNPKTDKGEGDNPTSSTKETKP